MGLVPVLLLGGTQLHAQEMPPEPPVATAAPSPDPSDDGAADDGADDGAADDAAAGDGAEEPPAPKPTAAPLTREDKQRRREAAQAARETAQPREPLVDVNTPQAPKWERRLEVGASFAFMLRPFANALETSNIGYQPAPGFGVHLHWPVVSWLRFHPYFIHAFHSLDIPLGALGTGSEQSISAEATISDELVATFVLGAKIAPTLEFNDRWRAWITAGVGWGRFEFPTMTVTETDGTTYEIRDRAGVIVEFPLGLGVSFDVIERWMAIHYEATAAPISGQSGTAHEVFQAVDADGNIRDVGAFGAIDVSFVQTLGVSVIL